MPPAKSPAYLATRRRVARLGGLARAAALSAERRAEIARAAGVVGGRAGKGVKRPRKVTHGQRVS